MTPTLTRSEESTDRSSSKRDAIELKSYSNPCDPLEPSVRLEFAASDIVVRLYPAIGHAIELDPHDAGNLAKSVYEFAQDFAEYRRKQESPEDEIEDLRDDLDQARDQILCLEEELEGRDTFYGRVATGLAALEELLPEMADPLLREQVRSLRALVG